ncbi:MAG: hypothetical protein GXO74_06530 [Calditrichaeota bacterium]|nr:hypothetical protein [Calditrichota bacterium]
MSDLRIKICQLLENIKSGDFSSLCKSVRESLFWCSEIVVCAKNLNNVNSFSNNILNHDFKLADLPNSDRENNNFQFSCKIRKLKAKQYFAKGYSCFAAVNGSQIIADVWYLIPKKGNRQIKHEHFPWFGFQIENNDAYMFDMYITDQSRGGGLVNALLNFSFSQLKNYGYRRVYGTYRKDNLPALWMHRTAGYEELFQVKVYRLLFFRWSKKIGN